MKIINKIAIATLFMSSVSLNAIGASVDHFKGAASPDLQSALCNLQKFDARLKVITSETLTPTAMAEIHQLTYTLEVALQKVQQELASAAEELEKVHKGSEVMAANKVKASAKQYLSVTQSLTQTVTCK